ncbi:MAG: hypothetical protein Q9209_002074 [Squamulea sp. 1 TL-2023]
MSRSISGFTGGRWCRTTSRGGSSQYGQASGHVPDYGNDQFTDSRKHIYNPQTERPSTTVEAKEECDRPIAGPLIFESIGGEPSLPVRPGFGTLGTPIQLRTNHFPLHLDLEKTIYRYHVEITDPEIPKGRQRRQFFFILFNEVDECRSRKDRVVTDHAETLITAGKLELGVSDTKEYRLKYHEEGKLPRESSKASRVIITLTGLVPIPELLRYLDSVPGDSSDLENRLMTVQALNVIVDATPNENPKVCQACRNVYSEFPRNSNPNTMDDYKKTDLSCGLIGVRSYYSSVRTSTGRDLLNLHGQCKPFYPELNLHELMRAFSPNLDDPYTLEKFISKLRVRFRYLKDVKGEVIESVKTVYGFSHKREAVRDEIGAAKSDPQGNAIWRGNAEQHYGSSESIQFQSLKYPGRLTVAEYFQKEHGIVLEHPGTMVVNFGSDTNPVWIPAELGIVEPDQPYRGKLNDGQTSNMLAIAARGPAENARRLVGAGTQVIGIYANNPILSEFGISIDTKMIVVPARILQPPTLLYANRKTIIPRNASWNLAGGTRFYQPKDLKNWSYVLCGQSKFLSVHRTALCNQIKACGLGNSEPFPFDGYQTTLGKGDDDTTDEALQEVLQRAKADGVKFLFVILESFSKPIHARLKYFADIKIGIQHTTLVSNEYIAQCKKGHGDDYFASVMQKVNVKVGGINHILDKKGDPLDFFARSSTMLVGLDVTHPATKNMVKPPSVVGLVASLDENFTTWLETTKLQEGRKEMVDDIGELMGKRLQAYGEKHQRYPQNIIIYRDGVSEGQFKTVLTEEVSAIEAKCKEKYTRKKFKMPKVVVIICGKRHHTRFFPTKEKDADEKHNCNPKSGTVVDRGVSSEKYYDFFIQPHAALNGTAIPCHCTVIRDDINIGPDVLHKVTHNLSYLYGRATKAVSLCTPAYYADIMCERGNKYLQKYLNKQWPPETHFDFNNSPWVEHVHRE